MVPRTYLAGWDTDNIIEIKVDKTHVLSDLTNIPNLVHISISTGANSTDLSVIFDRLLSDSNKLKIAIADMDGNQQYVEILKWDHANKDAWLVFQASNMYTARDTYYFLYFDPDHADNTTYVGGIGSAAGYNVYETQPAYLYVHNLENDPTGTPAAYDSHQTQVGPKNGTNVGSIQANDLVSAKASRGLDLNGITGGISLGTGTNITLDGTFEIIFKTGASLIDCVLVACSIGTTDTDVDLNTSYRIKVLSNGKLEFSYEDSAQNDFAEVTTNPYIVETNTWYSVVVTKKSSVEPFDIKFYVDGILKETKTVTDVSAGGASSVGTIGYEQSDGSPINSINGIIDLVAISTSVRTADWIKAKYHSFFAQDLNFYSWIYSPDCVTPDEATQIEPSIPDTIIEINFDTILSLQKYGHATYFDDVNPSLGKVTDLPMSINQKGGFVSVSALTFEIKGDENFQSFINTEYLKNRRVTRRDGFILSGAVYSDYIETFSGLISDFSIRNNILKITAINDLGVKSKVNIPAVDPPDDLDDGGTASTIQSAIYSGENIIDIMRDILMGGVVATNPVTGANNTSMEIASAQIDIKQFDNERDIWFVGALVQRVLIDPVPAKQLLNELMIETNSYIIDNLSKITFKPFVPMTRNENILKEYTDTDQILTNSVSQDSGYDNFFNKIIFMYDYNESGEDKDGDYETWYVRENTTSSGSSQQAETKEKTIKSKWIKSIQHNQPKEVDATIGDAFIIYYVSRFNSSGTGTLTFNFTNKTLTWTAPGGSAGTTINVEENGRYRIEDIVTNKFIRVAVKAFESDGTTNNLPTGNKTLSITLTLLTPDALALQTSNRLINRYSNPTSKIEFDIDLNDFDNVKGGGITAFTDAGGGQVTVTSDGTHGLSAGNTVGIIGSTNYNGSFIITNPATDTYEITKAWAGDDAAGTWKAKLRPGNFIELTTGGASVKGAATLANEQMQVISVKPIKRFDIVKIACVQTRLTGIYGFIAPSSQTADWDPATDDEKKYCYIGDGNNQLGSGNDQGFLIM